MRTSLWLGLLAFPAALAAGPPPLPGKVPESAGPASHWRHLRIDAVGLRALGNGTVEDGMNVLGAQGYSLFTVVSMPSGSSGWFLFKLAPQPQQIPVPRYTYRIRQDSDFSGDGGFDAGLAAFEREGWELRAITARDNGGVGWYYFVRDDSDARRP